MITFDKIFRLGCVCAIGVLFTGTISQAQIVHDGTLGPAGALTGPDFTIPHTNGTVTGNNLFHSFSQLNIQVTESATFTGPANINNVLSRVTGGSLSRIDGFLRTDGMPNANFFLMNPAGVIFGPDAQLDVPAAFVVTTANVIELADGGQFVATIDPLDTVLTTAPPSAFGFLEDNPASVQLDQGSLEVGQNRAISIIGGDLQIQGDINAPSGRVSLMSVASSGTVTYDASNQTADLEVETFDTLGEIEISNGAELNVAGDPGGTVVIRAGQFVLEGSNMTAQTQGEADHPGAGFDIYVTGDMILTGTPGGAAEIASSSAGGANGNAGNIKITAKTLEITGEPSSGYETNIGSRSFGAGDAGNVEITTERLTLNELSYISAPALSTGNGGDITIEADTVELLGDDGWCYISTLSQGGGAAGNIDLTADNLLVRGGSGGFVGLTTQTNQFGTGAPGQMQITANDVQLFNGAQLSASLFNGEAIGGNIEVTADSILISGRNPYGYSAGIFSSASEWDTVNPLVTVGKGGSIQISTDTLTIDNGGLLGAWTEGRGDAGEIEIDAHDINIFNWSGIRNNAWFAAGDAGDIHINTDTLNVQNRSYITSQAYHSDPSVTANAGNLDINAQSIYIAGPESATDPFGADFTGFSTSASGGHAGSLSITAESLEMTDRASITATASGSESAGYMQINVGSMQVLNGSHLLSSTFGSGAGGSVEVTADEVAVSGVHPEPYTFMDDTQLAPSSIASETGLGGGQAGNISITANLFEVLDGGIVTVSTVGPGDAGTIEVTAQDVLVSGFNTEHEQYLQEQGKDPTFANSSILSMAGDRFLDQLPDGTGDAGNIMIQADELLVTDRGIIASKTDTPGAGGIIDLELRNLYVSETGEIASSSTSLGNAGNIRINASHRIKVYNDGSITTSSDQANAGDLDLNAGQKFTLADSRITAQAAGDGGNIFLNAPGDTSLFNSEISTQAGGTGGNITFDTDISVFDHSWLSADASLGNGGNILIDTNLFLESHSKMTASSEFGVAGTIKITAPILNLAGTLTPLPEHLMSAEVQLLGPCVQRFLRGSSSFVVTGRDGLPLEPGAWLPSFELQTHELITESELDDPNTPAQLRFEP